MSRARAPSPGGALDYRPSFPAGDRSRVGDRRLRRPREGLHLPAYEAWNVDVAGVYDPLPRRRAACATRSRSCGSVYASLDELLADPEVDVVDIATRPRGAASRSSCGPSRRGSTCSPRSRSRSTSSRRARVVEEAERGGREARREPERALVRRRARARRCSSTPGAIGDVVAVTHLHDKPMPPVVGTALRRARPLHDLRLRRPLDRHQPLLARRRPCRSRCGRPSTGVPGQPDNARNPWGANVEIRYASGANVLIRTVGDARTARGGAPFWIHGTEGTIRGSVLLGSDFLELDRDGEVDAVRARGRLVSRGARGDDGRAARRRSPRTASRTTRRATTSCRSSSRWPRAARPKIDGAPVTL